MRILYISQYFPPEMGAPAARVSELARYWVQAGHQVTVLTGFPNHPTGQIHPDYKDKFKRLVDRETYQGVNVVRTWLLPFPNRKPYERILNYASFWLSASLTGIFVDKPDVIIATSPQLLVGLVGWWLAKVKRVPFVFEVRDLWPETITAVGVGENDGAMIRSLRNLSRCLYQVSDHIVVVTPSFKDKLVHCWSINADKITIVENGVETDVFKPDGRTVNEKPILNTENKFVVSYIGTHGFCQGLDSVLRAAVALESSHPDILFLFVGEGAEKENLIEYAHDKQLNNVRFLPGQPRQDVPLFIRASQACLVPLRKSDVFKTVIPTKMLEFMACGRPLILGVDGMARQVMEEAQAGIFSKPEDSQALQQAIETLYHDDELRMGLGRNGRRFVVKNLSREKTAEQYIHLLDKIVSNSPTPTEIK